MNNGFDTPESLNDALDRDGLVLISGKGISMLPLIRNSRDRICIRRLPREPRRYDILVYRTSRGLAAHRLLAYSADGCLLLCGDNQLRPERVSRDKIVAYLPGMLRGDTYLDFATSRKYALYCRVWCCSLLLRRCFLFFLRQSPLYKREKSAACAD